MSAKSLWQGAKKSFVGWRQFVGERSWLLVAVNVVLFCCCFVLASCLGHLKGKCMTKLMKVCIRNNQHIDSWKCTSTETLDKNKKTRKHWYLRLDVGITKQTDKVCRNRLRIWMKCLFSIVFVFKWSICVVALSSLYSKLLFSPLAP